MSLNGTGATKIATSISHKISERTPVVFPDKNALQIFVRWKRGVKKAIFEITAGSASMGKNIPEKRNIGVIKSV